MARENTMLENWKSLKENQDRLIKKETDKINESISEREKFMKNYYSLRESKRKQENSRSEIMESARNEALSTVLKAIYITALEANSLTDHGLMLAEEMVDSYIKENGGASKILGRCANKTYLLHRISEIVNEAAEDDVKEIEKDVDEIDDKEESGKDDNLDLSDTDSEESTSKEEVGAEVSADEKQDIIDKAKEFIQTADKEEVKDLIDNIKDAADEKKKEDKVEEKQEKVDKANQELADAKAEAGQGGDDEEPGEEIDTEVEIKDDVKEETPSEEEKKEDTEEAEVKEEDKEEESESKEDEESDDKEEESSEENVEEKDEEEEDNLTDVDDFDSDDKDIEVEDDDDENDSDSGSSDESSEDSDKESDTEEVEVDSDEEEEDDDLPDDIEDDEEIEVDNVEEVEDDDDDEHGKKIFDDLDKEEDVKKAVELIRDRVASAEEKFIKNNTEDKKKIDDLLDKISNSVKTVEDLNDKNDKKAEAEKAVQQEQVQRSYQKINAIREQRVLTVFEKMTREFNKGIVKDHKLLESYTDSETGQMDIALAVEAAKIKYAWLETVNTLQLETVDAKYIEKVINSMNAKKK